MLFRSPLVVMEDENKLAQASPDLSAISKKEFLSENELAKALPTKTKTEETDTTRQATIDEDGLFSGLTRRWNQVQAALGDLFASELNQRNQTLSVQQNRIMDAKKVQKNRVIDAKKVHENRVISAKKVQTKRVRQAKAKPQN